MLFEPAEISVDSVEALDSRTALLRWSLEYKGNLPIKRYHLQMKNYSTAGGSADWLDMDDKIPANATSYTVRYLAPAVTYGFQLAAVNEAGHSNWEAKNLTMPADVPPKITWVQMMASTNETLLFGWRRPSHDNGAEISNYVVQLSQEQKVVANETLPVLPSEKQNYIFIFVGLEPGECYAFQVQACSTIGCGSWSDELDAITADGMADPPENVEMRCFHDSTLNYVVVTWDTPKNARGSVQAYNITLEGNTRYRNDSGFIVPDNFEEFNEVPKESQVFKRTVRPNTKYAVKVCTVNRAGCGPVSRSTDKSSCISPPSVPAWMPDFELGTLEGPEKCRQLRLKLQRVSERNGFIRCYRVVVIKLGKGDSISTLPQNPHYINLTSYEEVHQETDNRGAYLAEAFDSENFSSEVVIGDGEFSLCDPRSEPPFRLRRSTEEEIEEEERTLRVYDGALDPDTNYSGYVEVQVWGPDGQILAKQSEYFKPAQTSKCSLSSSGSSAGTAPPVRPADSPMTFLFGVICGTILVVLVLILVICLIRRRNSCPYDGDDGEHLGLTALLRRTVHRSSHLARGSHLAKLPYFGPIAAEELPAVYAEKHLDTDLLFRSEFEALPDVFRDRSTTASDCIENACKNRYPEIKAYDQTRVRLSSDVDVVGSDYINANFIEGYKERKLYICAQAPLKHTISDFWRMIWQQGVSVIVMLTGLEENGEEKCAQYWSDGKPLEISYFSVTLVSFKKCSDYILRTLILKCSKNEETCQREVLHFHFLMWSDFLSPGQPSWLLRFIKRVNEHYSADRGPLLVHCSEGVGRTGTYVAIDSLRQQLDEEGIVDIFAFVTHLRYHRSHLIRTLEEYMFVYRALMEHAQFGDTELELHHLRDHYELLKGKVRDNCRTGLEVEFEKLNDVFEEPKTYCVGAWDVNRCKNRYECIIPYDMNRVILLPSITDQSSYINASHIQGYYRSLSFIITQDPLPQTIWDFWRMVKEQHITTLVMLSELGPDLNKCPQYWPNEEEEEIYETVRVKLKSCSHTSHYILRQFIVTDMEDDQKHLLSQFQLVNWSLCGSGVPDNLSSLIVAIEHVQQHYNNQPSSGPITVHCSGGGDRSGIYVALSDLIEQARCDERVDVFQTTKYARAQRHCLLQTLEQYDFLYRGLIHYVERYNLCNMGDTQL
ncbi:tyrosine-protein phosphatase 69D-like [Uloborus diversus]|uniref:tyrosine-protein phosphatase 69D-like n=1 Tax=Uloborus diversus TaxID=327109 RepID=UPI0024091821|nr:tyrosine-protein phosphatase 69D-like [Uloborus diversus]